MTRASSGGVFFLRGAFAIRHGFDARFRCGFHAFFVNAFRFDLVFGAERPILVHPIEQSIPECFDAPSHTADPVTMFPPSLFFVSPPQNEYERQPSIKASVFLISHLVKQDFIAVCKREQVRAFE